MFGRQNPTMWEMAELYTGEAPLDLLSQPGQGRSSITWERLHWMRCVEAFTSFVVLNNQGLLVITMPVIVFARDLQLRPIEDSLGPL